MAGAVMQENITALFKNKAPVNTIFATVSMTLPPPDWHMLSCFAVYYDSSIEDILRFMTCKRVPVYSPLITAVYKKRYEVMPQLASDYLRNGGNLSYHEGFGKIESNAIVGDKAITVWDAIFELDDPEALVLLSEYCFREPCALAAVAREHGARKCYELITNSSWNRRPLLRRIPSTLRLGIKHFIQWRSYARNNAMKRPHMAILFRALAIQGEMKATMYRDALSTWRALNSINSTFLTAADVKQIEILLSQNHDSLVSHCQNEHQILSVTQSHIPDDNDRNWAGALTLHAKALLASWHALLKGPERQRILTDTDFMRQISISMIALSLSHNHGPTFVAHVNCESAIFLLNTILKMYLQAGGAICYEYINDMGRLFGVIGCRFKELSPLARALGCKHLLILFVYRYRRIPFNIFTHTSDRIRYEKSRQSIHGQKMVDTLNSIIPQVLHNVHRINAEARRARYEAQLEGAEAYPGEHRAIRKNMRKIPLLTSPRSLKELCRVALYRAYPGHDFPRWVQDLDIPTSLKYYLTLGVCPVPEHPLESPAESLAEYPALSC